MPHCLSGIILVILAACCDVMFTLNYRHIHAHLYSLPTTLIDRGRVSASVLALSRIKRHNSYRTPLLLAACCGVLSTLFYHPIHDHLISTLPTSVRPDFVLLPYSRNLMDHGIAFACATGSTIIIITFASILFCSQHEGICS